MHSLLQVQRLFAEDLRADVYNTQPFCGCVFDSSRNTSLNKEVTSMNATNFFNFLNLFFRFYIIFFYKY